MIAAILKLRRKLRRNRERVRRRLVADDSMFAAASTQPDDFMPTVVYGPDPNPLGPTIFQ